MKLPIADGDKISEIETPLDLIKSHQRETFRQACGGAALTRQFDAASG